MERNLSVSFSKAAPSSDISKLDLKGSVGQKDEFDIDSCGMEDGGLDTKRSFSDLDSLSADDYFNDEGPPADGDDLIDNEDGADGTKRSGNDGDRILDEIRDSIARRQSGARSDGSSTNGSDGSPHVNVSSQFLSIPYGLIPRATYEHGKRNTDIMGVTYNARMRQFIILDSKGVTTWKRDAVDHRVSRALAYPKYEYRLITNMVYAKKYNCYFVLGKDFSLKVYNRDFYETCSVSADLRSVLFMLFNPVRDELITGGVGGTKVWRFHQQAGKSFGMLRPLSNYGLTLKYELPNVGGSWVKRVELDHHLEHLYCCSDTDLHVYDLGGKLLFKFERAHHMSITGCRYSKNASVLVTSSIDTEVKVWSLMGGLVHTFRGHSRAVTNLILHPATSSIIVTCSLDGTVRMWSLDTMDCLYSLVVSVDGVLWMGLTDDNLLYLSTPRAVTLWNLNYSVQFWALARSRVTRMTLCGCKEKTTRLMAISEDSSVRLMARSNSKNLTTVLPPPSISPLQRVLSVCYSREFNAIYMLINPHEIWVYTTRTDPACRIAVWDVIDIQSMFLGSRSGAAAVEGFNPASISVNKPAPSHRATENGAGNEVLANCCCIAILNSTAMVWTDEGYGCPIRDSYLLLGLEDGRILFMDPVIKGHKYLEFKTGKDPVLDIYHDVAHNDLITVYKVTEMIQVHVWSLPDLELQHEIYTAPDMRDYARVGYTLVTGHESGCVLFHALEQATDPGLNRAKMIPAYDDVVDVKRKPEHFAPVIAVDVCVSIKIFCTCSNDGAIKIWNDENVLMTEIMLDSSLSSACFLNNMGDLLVGFQKQIFCIDHAKVCPQLTVPESDVDSFDKESYICEDPAVLYEGVTPNPDPVTLQNYLVPFDIEFSKDFLEGKVKLEPEVVKQEESDSESQASMAPTEIYMSPDSTPRRRLSLVDLTLGSEVSKYDLLKHMKKTLDHLAEKAHREAEEAENERRKEAENKNAAYLRKRRRLIRRGEPVDELDAKMAAKAEEDVADGMETEEEEGMERRFSFPRFGVSPGATPESSSPPTPDVLSEEESEGLDVTQETVDVQMKVQVVQVVKKDEDDEISKFLKTEEDKKSKEEKGGESPSPRRKFGFSDIKVDAQTLMKDVKKTSPRSPVTPKRRPEQAAEARKASESDSDAGEKRSGRREKPAKKKMMSASQRKHKQKKGQKADADRIDPREAPPTQMQALELQEQKLGADNKLSQNGQDRTQQIKGKTSEAGSALKGDKESGQKQRASTSDMNAKQTRGANIGIPTTTRSLTVPDLPTVPASAEGAKDSVPRPSTSAARLPTSNKSGGGKSAIDFGQDVTGGTPPGAGVGVGKVDVQQLADSGADVSGQPGHTENASVVSGGSEDARAAFRIGLLSKEGQDTSGFEDGTSTSFAGFEGTPDSGWVERDFISVSKQVVQRDDQYLDEDGDQSLMEARAMSAERARTEDLLSTSEISKAKTRPLTSVEDKMLDKPELQSAIKYFRQRPHTAQMRFQTELELIMELPKSHKDLQTAFDTSLMKYKRMASTPLASDKLYKNDDQAFSENWHERQIERHMLIRMQKELRAQNALKRRQTMEVRKQERWNQHLIEDHVQDRRSSVSHVPPNAYQRASTVHGTRPAQHVPAPTPVSSRPHTATGVHDRQLLPQQLLQHQQQYHHQQQQQQRSHPPGMTLQQQIQWAQDQRARQHDIELGLREKTELGQEKAFRFRLRQQQEAEAEDDQRNLDLAHSIDPWLLDPRNPHAVRPKSSKSIPSKCHRYVLVTRPKPKLAFPLPTPLEEQLLATRFPEQGERVFKRYEGLLFRPQRRPNYGIGYSPYQHQLYG